MNILITICARGGSKGIPGKNIKVIAGKPLINYSLEIAQKLAQKYNAKIAISTDDTLIKQAAEEFSVYTDYMRPNFLATDTAGKIPTIKDLILYEESLINNNYEYILDLDVTSPLRNLEDLEKSFEMLLASDAITLFSVNPASRNPYFNMVEEKENGFFSLVKTNTDGNVMTRQSAPKVYDLNASFYWYKREFFDTGSISPITDKSMVYIMNHICFDLDHPIDLSFMEFLLDNDKLDFNL
jgi:CMP-N-acetylneuraminic acid synthetase